jgi:hypothetical protein
MKIFMNGLNYLEKKKLKINNNRAVYASPHTAGTLRHTA